MCIRDSTSTAADWPEELARRAGSLYPGGPAPVSRAALAGAIARELLALCPAFDCLDEYRARCFVPGHWVTVCAETETYAAKALAIEMCIRDSHVSVTVCKFSGLVCRWRAASVSKDFVRRFKVGKITDFSSCV